MPEHVLWSYFCKPAQHKRSLHGFAWDFAKKTPSFINIGRAVETNELCPGRLFFHYKRSARISFKYSPQNSVSSSQLAPYFMTQNNSISPTYFQVGFDHRVVISADVCPNVTLTYKISFPPFPDCESQSLNVFLVALL